MKFKTINTPECVLLLVEIATAKEMLKFKFATYVESNEHYDLSDFTMFIEIDNDISCSYPQYDYIGDTVVASIEFYRKLTADREIAKMQDYLLQKLNK
jgi:hypothetical protein